MVNNYSLKTDSEKQLETNFRVREFACPDGSDVVKIDDVLVHFLQIIRNSLKQPVFIGSGYRTPSYNALIGGDPNSDHMTGRAADIDVGRGVLEINARKIAMCAEALGVKRIGLYQYATGQSWVHIGSYSVPLKWFDSAPGNHVSVKTFIPVLRRQFGIYTNQFEVKTAQEILTKLGLYTDKIDGKFGGNTLKAVKAFQDKFHLEIDGVIGANTWRQLFNV